MIIKKSIKESRIVDVSIKKSLRQIIGLGILLSFLTGCSGNPPATPTAVPPTMVPPTATISSPVETDIPTPVATEVTSQILEAGLIQDGGRIQFASNTTSWYTNGDLAPTSAIRFTVAAMQGQQMNIWLTTDPATGEDPLASLNITDANGQVFTPDTVAYWSSILPTSQDYFVEVRSLAQEQIQYTISIEIPAETIDPANAEKYEPISTDVCQMLQETASQSLSVNFSLENPAPFLDTVAKEAGQGCHLIAIGNGYNFSSPQAVVTTLVNSVGLGWTEQSAYQADGPTGSTTALTRDMGLMLVKAEWKPEMGAVCPSNLPVADCNLTPKQKRYTIQIDVAQYRADFSLDGHWENPVMAFSLDLFQDGKSINGTHLSIGQDGDLIDSLDDSIHGSLIGKVATVEFNSSFTNSIGIAEITYVDVNTITWKIITPPDGEFYLPDEATLTRE